MSIITISRQRCSFGNEIAEALAQKLGWELITRERLLTTFMSVTKHELHMLTESAKFYLTPSPSGETYIACIRRIMHEYARRHSAVLVGFGSAVLFAGEKDALHIRITAPQSIRVARLKKQYHVTDEQAQQILIKADKKQRKFVSTIYSVNVSDIESYHMTLSTASLSVNECVAAIVAMLREREFLLDVEKQTQETGVLNNTSDVAVLKNQAEIEFAKLLDMYQIDWKYEPKTFPVEWDAEGNVTSAFSPDFYLTNFNTYIELTTMNQKYVTEKNKKIKKLRELYPGTNIKVVYKKDFRSLVERFNLDRRQ